MRRGVGGIERGGLAESRAGDKRAAEQRAADHQRAIDRGEAGLLDPFSATNETTLLDLVESYLDSLRAKNRAPRYVAGLSERLTFAFRSMGARFVRDATPQRVDAFLAQLPGDMTIEELRDLLGSDPTTNTEDDGDDE